MVSAYRSVKGVKKDGGGFTFRSIKCFCSAGKLMILLMCCVHNNLRYVSGGQ